MNATQFQDQVAFVRPQIFNFQLAPGAIFGKAPQMHSFAKSVRHIAVHFNCNFPVPALGFEHACKSDELTSHPSLNHASLGRDSAIPESPIRNVSNFNSAAASNVRMALAVRPDRPITLPISLSATSS